MRIVKMSIIGLFAFTLGIKIVQATPSTTYWTPAVSDVQPFGVPHIGIDNYFTVAGGKNTTDLATDVGITIGVLPFEKLLLEVGIDWLEPSSDPMYFNAKLGTPESSIFNGSPALNVGIFNVGVDTEDATEDEDGRTDYNIAHVMLGKTLKFGDTFLGRLHAGAYSGNDKVLVDEDGEEANTGFMVGYDYGFKSETDDKGEYYKWVFAADYASGDNSFGGGGFGIYYYFSRNFSLLTGPIWFNKPELAVGNEDVNFVWTTQLDINL